MNKERKRFLLILAVITFITFTIYLSWSPSSESSTDYQGKTKQVRLIEELQSKLKEREAERDRLAALVKDQRDKQDIKKGEEGEEGEEEKVKEKEEASVDQFKSPNLGIRNYDRVLDVTNKALAYAFYVTDDIYYCAAAATAHRLRQWTDYDIVFIFITANSYTPGSHITNKLNKLTNIKHKFIDSSIQARFPGQDSTWRDSLNKFYVFTLTEYDRIIFLDADTVVLRNLDHLFFIPDCTLASPRAYWLDNQPFFTSLLMVLKPSQHTFDALVKATETSRGWDMDVLNDYFIKRPDYLMLPGIYGLLNAELALGETHWFGDDVEDTYNNKAYLYHWSYFKPWRINANDQRVTNHGRVVKDTYHEYYIGKEKYC
ncbi:hypothetical protein DFA_08504 [Cavenderia fasciculata]|uniref:Glycosyltransferase n=1 Tax=Cavenderia fasciculata TaxID=261658 RepID=F4Q2P1_CACFS|nr:uncharacterized protein DFA_08504 [Cavenderia fasciculata]EGG17508.1 hypothetical protein DFA_08504 [Cavenderia fasciculata]|eukprot:XP_004355992.1 hypothetical protein DFA_08504 [Cavenderia fasciculata]